MFQITGQISKEQYLSGHCFKQTPVSSDVNNFSMKRGGITKPFSNPLKTETFVGANRAVVMPRYDPNGYNALVMPRPDASHQVHVCTEIYTVLARSTRSNIELTFRGF